MKFRRIFKKLTVVIVAFTMVMSCVACGKQVSEEHVTTIALENDVTINLWYSDSKMTSYFEGMAEKYHNANNHVTIVPTLVGTDSYLENIYNGSVKEGNVSDIYVLSSDNIEKAYLMGITSANDTYAGSYSQDTYGNAALTASSYKDQLLGYPLTYDMAVMVYNKKYTSAKNTFKEITEFSNNYEHTEENEEVEVVIKWDVSDRFLNYPMAGAYMNVGGAGSEDSSTIELQSNNIKSCMTEFLNFKSEYGTVRNLTTLSGCIESFASNKLLYTIVKASDITKLDQTGVNYGVSKIPDLTNDLKTNSLSNTTMLMVNPYSANTEVAKNVAKAFTYDYAEEFNSMTGYISARGDLTSNPSEEYSNLHKIYADSTVKAKFMDIGDFYIRYEIMLHQVWDETDGATVDDAYAVFSEYATSQLGARLK